MSDNELMNTAAAYDGFAGFEDGVEGKEEQSSLSSTRGNPIIKFTKNGTWVLRDDTTEWPSDRELVATSVERWVARWIDGRPAEGTRMLAPGEKFPDIDKLNVSAPQNEWKEAFGKLYGPWQAQMLVHLLDPVTFHPFAFPTATSGGSIAVRELVRRTEWKRGFEGVDAYPVVKLGGTTFHSRRYGPTPRPHFIITRWIIRGAESTALPALPAPVEDDARAPVEVHVPDPRTVEPMPLSREMKDELPW